MSGKTRNASNWNKIIVLNDEGKEINEFELNKLGQLKKKFKRLKRRKIQEKNQKKKEFNNDEMDANNKNFEIKQEFDVEKIADLSLFDNFVKNKNENLPDDFSYSDFD